MGFPCVTVAGGVGGASEVGTAGLATSILDVCSIAERIITGTDILSRQLKKEIVDTSANIDFWASCIRAEKYLNWQPIIGLEEGIIKTWQWQKNL